MNETVMRIFYRVTNLGTETTGYRQKMHEAFARHYPQLEVTEQRIVDQYRTILRNKLLTENSINEIREEIECETGRVVQRSANRRSTNMHFPRERPIEDQEPDALRDATNQTEEMTELLAREMQRAKLEYDGTDPTTRPILPRINTSKDLATALSIMNDTIMPQYVEEAACLETLHMIIYSAATAICRVFKVKIRAKKEGKISHNQSEPPWSRRLKRRVDELRADIGRLTEYQRGVRSAKLLKHVTKIIEVHKVHTQRDPENVTVLQCLDTLHQKLGKYAARLNRYMCSNQRKQDNKLFTKSEKGFYRKLSTIERKSDCKYPTADVIYNFWSDQLATPVSANLDAPWISREVNRAESYSNMAHQPFTHEELSKIIGESHSWKAPGPDGVQNYWLKKLVCTHEKLSVLINEVLRQPHLMPHFLTQGVTYLLPKDYQNTQDPSKYRPITCLPTLYKLVTACITTRVYAHCNQNQLMAEQQKGCTKNAMGCKEQLTIDSIICNQAYSKQRNLFMAYIDYKKAFDSVPHDYLIAILRIYKVDNYIVEFLRHAMDKWRTSILLNEAEIQIDSISIKRGIFQGDSLSPLWFCLALNPLSNWLNSVGHGFGLRENNRELIKINHLLYMDDLKLMAATRKQLEDLLKMVETFSGDIRMQFGLDKCKTVNVVKGKIQHQDFGTHDGQLISAMRDGDTYKYLGMKQARKIDHKLMKKEVEQAFIDRVRKVLKSKLNSKNLFKALNTYACAVLVYSFGVVEWTKTDIEALQRKTRVLLTKARMHHPKSAIERTSIHRADGGRGMVDIGERLDQQIANLRKYFQIKAGQSEMHRAICQIDNSSPLCLKELQITLHHQTRTEKIRRWKEKPLHGRHLNELTQENVDKNASNYWLTSGKMFPETEGFIIAIQDQVVPTRNYLKYIVKDTSVTDGACRYGCLSQETIQHITSGCQLFAAREYKERHDAMAKIVHQELALKYKLIEKEKQKYYDYRPEVVLESNDYKLYWDRSILTDQTTRHNRPDIVLVNNQTREVTLIDIAVPNSNNLREKHAEKIGKYRDLEIQIQRQWNMRKVETIPIIMSTTGIIPKTLLSNLKSLGLKQNLFAVMQKAVLLGTSRIVRKFLGQKQQKGPERAST